MMLTKSYELFSPAELFARIAPHIPDLLVPQNNLSRILEFGKLLPPSLSPAGFGFESVLSGSSYRTDLSLSLDLLRLDKNRLKEWFKMDALPTLLRDNLAWHHLSFLIESGVDGQFFHNKILEQLWLEFDIGSDEAWPPSPNLFVTISINKMPQIVAASLGFMQNKKIISRIETLLDLASAHNLTGHHIGWMLGRAAEWIKMGFFKLSPHNCEPFLRSISYPYPIEPVVKLINQISPAVEYMMIQIDINAGSIGPKIGIECFNLPNIHGLLERFVVEGFITSEEQAALISWLGRKRYTINGEQHMFHRIINHLKIVYHPEQSLQTKAYFGGLWRPDSS